MLVLGAAAEVSDMTNYADTVSLYAFYVMLLATLWMIVTWAIGRAKRASMTSVTASPRKKRDF
jgi:hypothetical protein